MNNEMADIRVRMIDLGVKIVLENYVTDVVDGIAQLRSVYDADDTSGIACGSLIVVGARVGNDSLYRALQADPGRLETAGIMSVRSIGDCRAPGAIAHAVYSGHECARTIDDDGTGIPFALERALL